MTDLKEKLAAKVETPVVVKPKTSKVFKSYTKQGRQFKGEILRPDLNKILTPQNKEQEEFFKSLVKAGQLYEVEQE